MLKIVIEEANVCQFKADVISLKFAQSFFGADAAVARCLSEIPDRASYELQPGAHTFFSANDQLATSRVLFLGVVPMLYFDYSQIREFAKRSIEIIASELPSASHVAMTVHGVGNGLDEREAFLSQVGGILEAAETCKSVQLISIVESNPRRAKRLRALLETTLPKDEEAVVPASTQTTTAIPETQVPVPTVPIDAGIKSEEKKHVFVAMPFAKEYEDTFIFGIQVPIHQAGLLCERVDMAIFTGDVLERVKNRIDSASLVVADLTGANPNVYLEVGYAWGKGRPTLLFIRKGDELKFDVSGQRCIQYESIADLQKKLTSDLAGYHF